MKYLSLLLLTIIMGLFIAGCGEQTLPTDDDISGSGRIRLFYPDPNTVLNKYRVYFNWSGYEEANGYNFKLFKDGVEIVNQIEYTSTFKTLSPLFPGEYEWTVGMRDTSGVWGRWSDTISFTLIQEPYELYDYARMPGQSEGIYRNGDVIYVADNYAGISVIDFTDHQMTYLDSYKIPSQDRSMDIWIDHINNNMWVAANRSNPPVALFLLDDPLVPTYFTVSPWARRCSDIQGFYRGDNVYIAVADQDDGVHVFNVTNPASIDGSLFRVSGNTYGVEVYDTLLFVLAGELGVYIADLRDPRSLTEIGNVDTYGDARDAAILATENIAYIADGIAGLTIVDFSDPENPFVIRNMNIRIGNAQDAIIKDNHLFVSIGSRGVLIYDITNPREPESIQNIETMYAKRIFVDDDFLYIAERDWGAMVLQYNQ